VTDGNGKLWTYGFDGNRQTSATDPLGHTSSTAYDENGNVTRQTDANGNVTVTQYDDGRPTSVTVGYATSAAATTSYTYDANGNVLSETDPAGNVTRYGYDSANNQTSVTDPLGHVTITAYDQDNRATLVTMRVDFGYDANGNLLSQTRYADLAGTQKVGSTQSSYDAANRLTEIKHQNPQGSVLADFTYTPDPGGRLASETDNGVTTNYGYDATNQLLTAGGTGYSYDRNGNRTMPGYATGTGNQVLSNGAWNYTYDAAGNLIRQVPISDGLTWNFSYDNANQLTSATQSAASGTVLTQANYSYDAFGNRVQSSVSQNGGAPVVTKFAYGPSGLWADLTAAGSVQTRYLSGDQPDQWLGRADSSGAVAWLLTDHLGSVRALTDATGAVTDKLDYDAFGNVTKETAPSLTGRLRYAGYEWDADTGLYHDAARYYSAALGRFITQDPTGLGPDSNPERYVGNDPTNRTDPSGLDAQLPARGDSAIAWDWEQEAARQQKLVPVAAGAKTTSLRVDLSHIPADRIATMLQEGLAQQDKASGLVFIADVSGNSAYYLILEHGGAAERERIRNLEPPSLPFEDPSRYAARKAELERHKEWALKQADYYQMVDAHEVPVTGTPSLQEIDAIVQRYRTGFQKYIDGYLREAADKEPGRVGLAIFAVHMIPLGGAVYAAEEGNGWGATISAVGDVATFLPFLLPLKGVKAARAVRLVSVAGQLGVGTTRAAQGYFAWQDDRGKALGYLGEATLRLLGASTGLISEMRALRASRAAPGAAPESAAPGVGPGQELGAARQRIAGQIQEVARRRSLGTDPASGLYRGAEEEAALRLEQQLARQLRRDPSGAADWVDAAGRTYDAVGPVPVGKFDLTAFTRQIDRHLLKQGLDRVVVDVSGLRAGERAAVVTHIQGLTPAQQARIIVQPK
jgi:RHS repeat-associated protein